MKPFAFFLIAAAGLLSSCNSIPKDAVPVQPFDGNRYLGKWYEMARIDFTYEENLVRTTAEYSLGEAGGFKVVNRGFDTLKQEWTTANGKARFRGATNRGELEVSFFGPFYAGYNVIAVDTGYRWALVAGQSVDYLWVLSREKTIPDSIRTDYLRVATRSGFDTTRLIWVKQD